MTDRYRLLLSARLAQVGQIVRHEIGKRKRKRSGCDRVRVNGKERRACVANVVGFTTASPRCLNPPGPRPEGPVHGLKMKLNILNPNLESLESDSARAPMRTRSHSSARIHSPAGRPPAQQGNGHV